MGSGSPIYNYVVYMGHNERIQERIYPFCFDNTHQKTPCLMKQNQNNVSENHTVVGILLSIKPKEQERRQVL